MHSTAKGDKLEDALHEYLLDQQRRGELLYETHHPDHCRIHRKKKYFCRERNGDVEFDVVIEIYRKGSDKPQFLVIFECKNYERSVPEKEARDFASKLRTIPYAAKGVFVISSRLQSGAQNVAESNGIGIAKYDVNGLEVVAERTGRSFLPSGFVRSQIIESETPAKSLRFSAFYEGSFFSEVSDLLDGLISYDENVKHAKRPKKSTVVPFMNEAALKRNAEGLLQEIGYRQGPVDLEKMCSSLALELHYSNALPQDADGRHVLGTANLDTNTIQINYHRNPLRKRFTLAHELGHFRLGHKKYLRSDNMIDSDLFSSADPGSERNYERLEFQANIFASLVILPDETFRVATAVACRLHDIKDRGHGRVYVDDQPSNRADYLKLLTDLSEYFQVSHQVIEIRLLRMGLLTDRRTRSEPINIAQSIGNLVPRK